jgi:hypothetical protein
LAAGLHNRLRRLHPSASARTFLSSESLLHPEDIFSSFLSRSFFLFRPRNRVSFAFDSGKNLLGPTIVFDLYLPTDRISRCYTKMHHLTLHSAHRFRDGQAISVSRGCLYCRCPFARTWASLGTVMRYSSLHSSLRTTYQEQFITGNFFPVVASSHLVLLEGIVDKSRFHTEAAICTELDAMCK